MSVQIANMILAQMTFSRAELIKANFGGVPSNVRCSVSGWRKKERLNSVAFGAQG
jgi:hypothetical protein